MPGFAACSNRLAGAALAVALVVAPAHALSDAERLHLLQSETVRVESVFLRLARAATADCARRGPQLGLVLHQRAQYPPEVRAEAERVFGLGAEPAVLAVTPDGAGARAGLRAGDAILAVDDAPLPSPPIAVTQGNAGRLAGEALDRAVADRPAILTVRRDGAVLSLTVTAEIACAGSITLEPSQLLDAEAGKGRVLITTGLVEFVRGDEELAFLIGHELGHLAVGEVRGRDAEGAADLAGLRFLKAAGYDPCAAPLILGRLAAARGQGWRIDASHGSTRRRIEALRAANGGTCPISAS